MGCTSSVQNISHPQQQKKSKLNDKQYIPDIQIMAPKVQQTTRDNENSINSLSTISTARSDSSIYYKNIQEEQNKERERNFDLKEVKQNSEYFNSYLVNLLEDINLNLRDYQVTEKYVQKRQIFKIQENMKENPAPLIASSLGKSKIMRRRKVFTKLLEQDLKIKI